MKKNKSNEDKINEVFQSYITCENNINKENTLGVSQEYNRKNYDDVTKRNKFKKEYFGDEKVKKDCYTKKIVHYSSKSAKAKYGEKKYTCHSTDVDHIIPEKKVYENLKSNPFLRDEDVRRIANDESNYRVVSSKLNRQKRDNSNIKVAFNGSIDVDLDGKVKMIVDQVKAGTNVKANATRATVKNVSSEFSSGAINSLEDAAIPLMVEGVNNLIQVANGDKEFNEAVKDMGEVTSKVVVRGGTVKVITTGINNVIRNGSSQLVNKIVANSNIIVKLINVALILKDSTFKFINGEISGKEFFKEIGEKGVELVASSMGAVVGQILIPIPIIGAMIGAIITSISCGEIFKSIKTLREHERKADYIEKLANIALAEMKKQREILEEIVEKELKVFDDSISNGFNQIYDSMISNDMEGFAGGLDTILSVFNETVMFKTREEFDDFFDDENAILIL